MLPNEMMTNIMFSTIMLIHRKTFRNRIFLYNFGPLKNF